MKNNLVIAVLGGLAACLLIYIGVTFTLWEPNPANWPEQVRGLSAIIGLGAFVFGFAATVSNVKHEW
jgi:hypothetical protein